MCVGGDFVLDEVAKIKSGALNAVIAMYQVAINKALGSGSGALTQLILREAIRIADEMIGNSEFKLPDIEEIPERMVEVYSLFGFSNKVEVMMPESGKESDIGSEFIIKVYDSIFKPVAYMLMKRGINYTLSPESFLAAYVIVKALEKRDIKPKVRIHVEPLKSIDDPLVIKIIVR